MTRPISDDHERQDAEPTIRARLDAAWADLDTALDRSNQDRLGVAMDKLRAIASEAEPETPEEYADYFRALSTLAFEQIWTARTLGRAVTANDMFETQRQLGLVVEDYPIVTTGEAPPYQNAVIATITLAVLMRNRRGILPLPNAPSRQTDDTFGLELSDGTYIRVASQTSPDHHEDGVYYAELSRALDEARKSAPSHRWHLELLAIKDTAERRLRIIEDCRQALAAQDRQSGAAHIIETLNNAAELITDHALRFLHEMRRRYRQR